MYLYLYTGLGKLNPNLYKQPICPSSSDTTNTLGTFLFCLIIMIVPKERSCYCLGSLNVIINRLKRVGYQATSTCPILGWDQARTSCWRSGLSRWKIFLRSYTGPVSTSGKTTDRHPRYYPEITLNLHNKLISVLLPLNLWGFLYCKQF